MQALLADLDQDLPLVAGRALHSIFIGGGTPSLFSATAIAELITGIRNRVSCKPDLEVTLEANPGTVDAGRFAELPEAGITRLSIGIQSFDETLLARVGRIHGRHEAIAAAEAAHAVGLSNFNLDLMYGLPGQSVRGSSDDLHQACALQPAHISYYQLTVEPNTPFHFRPPPLPDDELSWEMQQVGRKVLARHGYDAYEVSAHAQPARQCQHNLNYWQFGDYLGIGAGAHGKVTDVGDAAVVRRHKVRNPRNYLAHAHGPGRIAGERRLSAADIAFEFLLNALRLSSGFTEQQFDERTGLRLGMLGPELDIACERGLLERAQGRLRASALGARFLNDLLELFLPGDD